MRGSLGVNASRRERLRWAALWSAAFTVLGLLEFTHYYLDVLVRGGAQTFRIKFIEEMTASYGAAVCFLPAIWVNRQSQRQHWRPRRCLAVHTAVLLVISVVHTSWNWATMSALFPLAGLGPYDYGRMPLRFAMEFPTDVLFYTLVAGLSYLFVRYRTSRDREVRLATVESELRQARLEALEGQLRPHFLFNTLNTISSVMYDDPNAADAMLSRLADLLRRMLHRNGGAEVPLADELETLELYLGIMRSRFADRLRVRVDVGVDLRDAVVPALLLQPLLENAIVHGDPGPGTAMLITVSARRAQECLELAIEDNGPGVSEAAAGHAARSGRGIGLGTTARRLAHLYGTGAGVRIESRTDGGARTFVWLPYRRTA
jgi:signal transduction histidine kinase